MYNIYYNNASHNRFASYPGSVPNSGHQLDQRALATSAADISHTHPPTRPMTVSLAPAYSSSHVLIVSLLDHRVSL